MSNQPFMQLYVGDYLADTTDLTCEEHGAYLLLLMTMWRHGATLPNDAKKLARIARLSPRKWASVWAEIERFFVVEGDIISSLATEAWKERSRKESARPSIPNDVQRRVWERDGKVCSYCGTSEGPFHLDHIHPWSLGGEHTVENLTVACAPCNLSKGGKTLEEWRGATQ